MDKLYTTKDSSRGRVLPLVQSEVIEFLDTLLFSDTGFFTIRTNMAHADSSFAPA